MKKVSSTDLDKCRNKKNKCSKIRCGDESDPVCGTNAQTYKNLCDLSLATCMKGVQFAHVGNCTSLKESIPCPSDCPAQEYEEPVCGSDGNVYRFVDYIFQIIITSLSSKTIYRFSTISYKL